MFVTTIALGTIASHSQITKTHTNTFYVLCVNNIPIFRATPNTLIRFKINWNKHNLPFGRRRSSCTNHSTLPGRTRHSACISAIIFFQRWPKNTKQIVLINLFLIKYLLLLLSSFFLSVLVVAFSLHKIIKIFKFFVSSHHH